MDISNIFIPIFIFLICSSYALPESTPMMTTIQYLNHGFTWRGAGSKFDPEKPGNAAPFFHFTYDKGNKWEYEITKEGKKIVYNYLLPDQVSGDYIQNYGQTKVDSCDDVIIKFEYFQHIRVSDWGVEGKISALKDKIGVNATANIEYGEISGFLKLDDVAMSSSEYWYLFFVVALPPLGVVEFHPDFVTVTKNLPETISTPIEAMEYGLLLDEYGTLRFTNAFGGCTFHYDMFFRQYTEKHWDYNWTTKQISLSFWFNGWNITSHLCPYHNLSDIEKHIQAEFKNSSSVHIFFNGGREVEKNPKDLEKWLMSCYQYPGVINGTLEEIAPMVGYASGSQQKWLTTCYAIYSYIDNGIVDPKIHDMSIKGVDFLFFGFDGVNGNLVCPTSRNPIFTPSNNRMNEKYPKNIEILKNDKFKIDERYIVFDTPSQCRNVYENGLYKKHQDKGEVRAVYSLSTTHYVLKHSTSDQQRKKLSSIFVEELGGLNSLHKGGNPENYIAFMKRFGSHYVEEVEMGKRIEVELFFSIDNYNELSTKTKELLRKFFNGDSAMIDEMICRSDGKVIDCFEWERELNDYKNVISLERKTFPISMIIEDEDIRSSFDKVLFIQQEKIRKIFS